MAGNSVTTLFLEANIIDINKFPFIGVVGISVGSSLTYQRNLVRCVPYFELSSCPNFKCFPVSYQYNSHVLLKLSAS